MISSTTPAPAAGARAAWWHAGVVVLVTVVVVTVVPVGPWRPATEIVVFALGFAGTVTALRRHRTPQVLAWRALTACLGLFAASCASEVPALAGVLPDVFGPVESTLDVAAYVALVVAAVAVLRNGRRSRSRAAWADTATLLLAGGLAVLAVGGPERSALPGHVEMEIGTPLVTVVLLIVCVPLAVSRGRRSVSSVALLAAGVLTLAGYSGRLLLGPMRDTAILDPLPLLAVAAITWPAGTPRSRRWACGPIPIRTPRRAGYWAWAPRCWSAPHCSCSGPSVPAASGTSWAPAARC